VNGIKRADMAGAACRVSTRSINCAGSAAALANSVTLSAAASIPASAQQRRRRAAPQRAEVSRVK